MKTPRTKTLQEYRLQDVLVSNVKPSRTKGFRGILPQYLAKTQGQGPQNKTRIGILLYNFAIMSNRTALEIRALWDSRLTGWPRPRVKS